MYARLSRTKRKGVIKIKPNKNFYLLLAACFLLGFLFGCCAKVDLSVSNSADGKLVAEHVKMPSAVKNGLVSDVCVAQSYDEIVAAVEKTSEQEQKQAERQKNVLQLANRGDCLGKWRVTRYDGCEKCCGEWAKNRPTDENGNPIVYGASGRVLKSGVSCAADRSIPLGTKLYIPQIDLTVTVEDRAAEWIEERYNGKFVDLYFEDHAHYIAGATDYMKVYIVE